METLVIEDLHKQLDLYKQKELKLKASTLKSKQRPEFKESQKEYNKKLTCICSYKWNTVFKENYSECSMDN